MSKNLLDVMSLEQIKEKVNACHPGSFHKIMILDGDPVSLADGSTFYCTETLEVVFNIDYYKMPHVVLKQAIYMADNATDVRRCRAAIANLKHPEMLAKTAIAELEKKERLVAAGSAIPKCEFKHEDKKDRHADCPSISNSKNGHINLTCYKSFRNAIKRKVGGFDFYEIPITNRYFIRNGEAIKEVTLEDIEKDKKLEAAVKKAVDLGRTLAEKKKGGNTPVYSPRVTNILNIW